jgi:hypothetical protein
MHYTRWRRYGDPLGGRTFEGEPKRFFDAALGFVGDGCLRWPFGRNRRGYAKFEYNGRTESVCSLICRTKYGDRPTVKHEVAHSCGNGHLGCINPAHLRWATHSENVSDKIAHGTHQIGERHGMARLTAEKVREIRALQANLSQVELARLYGITNSAVWHIQHRKTWRHVE